MGQVRFEYGDELSFLLNRFVLLGHKRAYDPTKLRRRAIESFNSLSFAVSHDLSRYVQHMLGCLEKSVGSETINHFLCCSIFPAPYVHWWQWQSSKTLRVVPELLRWGANPNMKFWTRTIWREFLEGMLGHLGNMFDGLTWDISATSVNVANSLFVEIF